MEKKYWWKLLCIPILLYVIIVGTSMPLSPGVIDLSQRKGNTGETVTINVETYNTFLTKATNVRGWLKKDTTLLLTATDVKVIDDNNASFTFNLPSELPNQSQQEWFSFVLDSDVDGYGVLPECFRISQTAIDSTKEFRAWKNAELGSLSDRGNTFPFRGLLYETVRNTYFHVPLWFTMLFLLIGATWNSFKYLRTQNLDYDLKAEVMTTIAVLFGMLGIVTGMLWAKATWGTYWTWNEIKLNMTAISMLIYLAYFVLRDAFDDMERRARVASVYSLFAIVAAMVLINVVPRMTDSLHPGSGGNPAMGGEDLDSTMRMVFYPAIIGWTLLGFWIGTVYYRYRLLREKYLEQD